jgi:malonate transporter and related proteins
VLDIFSVTFPFFALVLCGYIAARRFLLPLEAISGLNGFVLFFALPCMLYRFGATTPIAQLLDVSVFSTWLLCALTMVGFTIAVSMNRRIAWNDASFGALVAAFPNTGFMGVPLLIALLGGQVAGPMIITITVDMVITTSLCVGLSRLDAADTHGMGVAMRNALKGMLFNPMPWAILGGVFASAMQLALPGPVGKTVCYWPMPRPPLRCSPLARCWRARKCWPLCMTIPPFPCATMCRWLCSNFFCTHCWCCW